MVEKMFRRKAAAKYLGVCERTVDRQKDIPRIRVSARLVYFRRSDLLAWLNSHATKPE